jgi:hypothetical protein
MTRVVALLVFSGVLLRAQTAAAPDAATLEYTGTPLVIPYTCSPDDLEWAGMSCDVSPCSIYVELSHAAGSAKTILITGDLHAPAATFYSLLLRTEDGGHTWREPFARIRGAELDGIQMHDAQTGWIGGQIMQPLALDPFFLLTTDGGKSWRRVPLFEEGTPGALLQFNFDSAEHGLALLDRGGGPKRYEIYETSTGGASWELHGQFDRQPDFAAPGATEWRVKPEPKLFRLEHREENSWRPFASFALNAAECRDKPKVEAPEPKP